MKTPLPWLTVIGIGEAGLEGLTPHLRHRVAEADFVMAAERVLGEIKSLEGFSGEAVSWGRPFLSSIDTLKAKRGKKVVVLATGDPLWYGAGAAFLRYFDSSEIEVIPAPSGFQLAAAKMRWALKSCHCLSVHGRSHEVVLNALAPHAKLLILAHNSASAKTIAKLITEAGYGEADLTALGHIGGGQESFINAKAKEWANKDFATEPPDHHIIALACPDEVANYLPSTPGLPDEAFTSDGTMTKSEVRAITLARLAPQPGGVLWDLGCGSGSVGIEWMRAAPDALAIGVDNRKDRLEAAEANALRLGVPSWQGVLGEALTALKNLPKPDAIFIGGGLERKLIEASLKHLKAGGRLVANSVTLESEALLTSIWQEHGGDLSRIGVSRAKAIGSKHSFEPLKAVVQWSLVKEK